MKTEDEIRQRIAKFRARQIDLAYDGMYSLVLEASIDELKWVLDIQDEKEEGLPFVGQLQIQR